MRRTYLFEAVVCFMSSVFFAGCSLSLPDKSQLTTVVVNIPKDEARSANYLLNDGSRFSTTAVPATLSGFDCFALSVSGEGIAGESVCNGRIQLGATTDFVAPGTSMTISVPAGKSRLIEVYGQYGNSGVCMTGDSHTGGTNSISVIKVGGTVIDLIADTSVTIGKSYDPNGSGITCTDSGSASYVQVFSTSFSHGSVTNPLATVSTDWGVVPSSQPQFSYSNASGSYLPTGTYSGGYATSSLNFQGNYWTGATSNSTSSKSGIRIQMGLRNVNSFVTNTAAGGDYVMAGALFEAHNNTYTRGYLCGIYKAFADANVRIAVARLDSATSAVLLSSTDTGIAIASFTGSTQIQCDLEGREGSTPYFKVRLESYNGTTCTSASCEATISPSGADLTASPISTSNSYAFGAASIISAGTGTGSGNNIYLDSFYVHQK